MKEVSMPVAKHIIFVFRLLRGISDIVSLFEYISRSSGKYEFFTVHLTMALSISLFHFIRNCTLRMTKQSSMVSVTPKISTLNGVKTFSFSFKISNSISPGGKPMLASHEWNVQGVLDPTTWSGCNISVGSLLGIPTNAKEY